VGQKDAILLCLQLVRAFGKISCVGVPSSEITLPGQLVHTKNITISWGRCPARGIFDEALACLCLVQKKLAFLCEKEMKLEDAPEAYRLFSDRKVHKIILVP